MKITLESTTQIVRVSGGVVECRVWEGVTEQGVKIQALIPRIAADADQDLTQFETELHEHKPPSAAVKAFPLSMIL